MKETIEQQLRTKEKEVTEQLDRIYSMVNAGQAESFVQLEFKRVVERLTEKFQLLVELMNEKKIEMKEADFLEQEEALKQQFKDEIVLVASSIDAAIEERAKKDQ